MRLVQNSRPPRNYGIVLLTAEDSTTVERNSSDLVVPQHRGILIHFETTDLTGTTAQYRMSITARFPDGGYEEVWQAATTITGVGDAEYLIYPGVSGGNLTEVDGIALPFVFRVNILIEGTTNASHNLDTYVDAHVLV